MNGYLMQELQYVPGEDLFVESFSPENNYGVVFEDDGDTGYFYAVEKDKDGPGLRVLDALHIYESEDKAADAESMGNMLEPAPGDGASLEGGAGADGRRSKLMILWSRDWKKAALILDGYCQAIFDFDKQGGYNINEFPPPNEFWTKEERKLTDELISSLF